MAYLDEAGLAYYNNKVKNRLGISMEGGSGYVTVNRSTQTKSGVTATQNGNAVFLSGSATAGTTFYLTDGFTLPAGTYAISNNGLEMSAYKVYMYLYDYSSGAIGSEIAHVNGGASVFTLDAETTCIIRITVSTGGGDGCVLMPSIESGVVADVYQMPDRTARASAYSANMLTAAIDATMYDAYDIDPADCGGYVRGYWNTSTGEYTANSSFLSVANAISLNGSNIIEIVPPSGCGVGILAYKNDDTFVAIGSSNVATAPQNADKIFSADVSAYEYVRVTFGRTDGSDPVAIDEFISQIGIRLYTKKDTQYAPIATTYSGSWSAGYYNRATAEAVSYNQFIRTEKFDCSNIHKITVMPPAGYGACIQLIAGDGSVRNIGSANTTNYPGSADNVITAYCDGYSVADIMIGRFTDGSAATKAADSAFIANISIDIRKYGSRAMQPYFAAEMEDTVSKVRDLLTEPAMVLPIVTDIHHGSTSGSPGALYSTDKDTWHHTAANLAAFAKRIKCDALINCGDNTDGNYDNSGDCVDISAEMLADMIGTGIPVLTAVGNHDTNYYTDTRYASELSMSQIYAAYMSATKDVHFRTGSNGTDYYKDFDGYGVRIVGINANYTPATTTHSVYSYNAETATWLADTALDTDYIVVLVEHLSSISTQNWNGQSLTNASAVTSALQSFVNSGGKLIQLCGHCHADYSFTSPWLAITNTCTKCEQCDTTTSGMSKITGYDSYGLASPAREYGTVTEDAWTVCVIRPESGKVDMIRFGAGEDRSYTL